VTLPSPGALAPPDRFQRLEDPGTDFPFYNGHPVALTGWQWMFVMAAVMAGFLVLMLPITWPGGPLGPLIPALLFALIPLAALARVAPGHWTLIFGKVGVREIRLMLGFALLNLVLSMGVGVAVNAFAEVTPNAAAEQLKAMDTAERIAFFAKTLPQLLGEELLTMLPFLALLAVLPRWLGVGRKGAIVGAWLISALLFGLLHLPTYDWNLVQCVVVIGTARLVLTLPWILTKNVWVSTGAHIINDWLLFTVGLVGAGLAATA
jgi:membrane protease YdiL (CAAX protease family)